MKPTTINGMTVPDFASDELKEAALDYAREPNMHVTYSQAFISGAKWQHQKLQDYFSNRVCVNCKHFADEGGDGIFCNSLDFNFNRIGKKPESFNCSVWSEK